MLSINNLCKDYDELKLSVLRDVSFNVEDGEIVMILGPSGCGKSTLLNIISKNIDLYRGSVNFKGRKLGYVFQEDRLLPWKSVIENVHLVDENSSFKKAKRMLKAVDMQGFENYYPKNLSGGMKQRCSIARALYFGSDLLLLDEPFKSLDHALRKEMLSLLYKINRETNISILYVTHDIDEALTLANRIIVFSNRPAKIIGNYKIEENQNLRNLEDTKYVELKKKIINLLGTPDK